MSKKTHEYGDAPIEEQYREKMLAMAKALDEFLNDGKKKGERHSGFVLLVFPFNDHGGRCNYISNGASRKDMIALFREQAARFEGQPEQEGHG